MDHVSQSLETIFGLKYLNSLMRILMRIRDPGFFFIQGPGWRKTGSGINSGFADGSFEKQDHLNEGGESSVLGQHVLVIPPGYKKSVNQN